MINLLLLFFFRSFYFSAIFQRSEAYEAPLSPADYFDMKAPTMSEMSAISIIWKSWKPLLESVSFFEAPVAPLPCTIELILF